MTRECAPAIGEWQKFANGARARQICRFLPAHGHDVRVGDTTALSLTWTRDELRRGTDAVECLPSAEISEDGCHG